MERSNNNNEKKNEEVAICCCCSSSNLRYFSGLTQKCFEHKKQEYSNWL